MCGICGVYSKNKPINKELFEQMVDLIEHRGPDDRGTFYDGQVALGHRRLSIIDLSADGHQPFAYEKGRYYIVYNGEIYNYLELKKELIAKGYTFHTKTDTEVVIAAYDCWNSGCVNHLNGMWAFCIYDRKQNLLFASRDRFGIKPFYYWKDKECFLFSSEIKQILKYRNTRPVANKDRLKEFLIIEGCHYSRETLFKGIHQLRAGENLIVDIKNNHFHIETYYKLNNLKVKKWSFQEASQRLKDCFQKAVKLRLRADVPVGSCLSGGLDSSSIVCMVNQLMDGKKNQGQFTVSSCYDDKKYDEQEYIDEVIKKTGVTAYKVFPSFDNLFSELDKIVWHMDEPFGSTSIFAQWTVFKEAKKHGLTVMLDGQGADEQLAGYERFYRPLLVYYLKNFHFRALKQEIKAYQKRYGKNEARRLFLIALVDTFVPDQIRKLVRRLRRKKKNTPFNEKDILSILERDIEQYHIKDCQQYIIDSIQYGLAELLRFEDRDSMAHSIEARVPFLDVDLVETIYQIPFEYKIRNGERKKVLREALKEVLPQKIKNRQSKLGFATPEDLWINQNYEIFREEIEKACDNLSGILEKDKVMKWFDSFQGNVKGGDSTIWRIICAGHWVKVFDVIL